MVCAPVLSPDTFRASTLSPGERAPSVHGFSFPPSAADFPLFSTSRPQGSLHVSTWMSNTSKPMCSHSLFPHQTNSSHGRPPQTKRRKQLSPSFSGPKTWMLLLALLPHTPLRLVQERRAQQPHQPPLLLWSKPPSSLIYTHHWCLCFRLHPQISLHAAAGGIFHKHET